MCLEGVGGAGDGMGGGCHIEMDEGGVGLESRHPHHYPPAGVAALHALDGEAGV